MRVVCVCVQERPASQIPQTSRTSKWNVFLENVRKQNVDYI